MAKIIFFILIGTFSTLSAQVSEGMSLLFNYEDKTLPWASNVRYNDIWGYTACDGTEYAIMGTLNNIWVFDITSGEEKLVIEEIPGSKAIWRDFKTYENYLYAVADQGDEGLKVYDLQFLPDSMPLVYDDNDEFVRAHNVYIEEDKKRLYVAGAFPDYNNMRVYDLETPSAPNLVGRPDLSPGGYVHDVFVQGDLAYCSHGGMGLYIWDFALPDAPVLLGSKVTGGYNHSSWISKDSNYLYYAEEIPYGRPMGILNISDVENNGLVIEQLFDAPLIATDPNGPTPHNPFVRGDYLFISYYEDGVQVFDITDPIDPQRVAYYDTFKFNSTYKGTRNNWGVYPFFPSGKIVASDTQKGLFVLSLDDIELDSISPPVTEKYKYLAVDSLTYCEGEAVVLDLSDSTALDITVSSIGTDESIVYEDGIAFFDEIGQYVVTAKENHCIVLQTDTFHVKEDAKVELNIAAVGNQLEETNEVGVDWYDGSGQLLALSNSVYKLDRAGGYYAQKITSNGCVSTSDLLIVDDFNFMDMYPTVLNGQLRVEALYANTRCFELRVSDAVGRLIYSVEHNDTNLQEVIDVSNWSKGMYFVEVSVDNDTEVIKVIKP